MNFELAQRESVMHFFLKYRTYEKNRPSEEWHSMLYYKELFDVVIKRYHKIPYDL